MSLRVDTILREYTPNSNETEVIIPDGVTVISDNAFSNCEKLESIVIPKSVKDIGESAFYKCSNLQNVFIPDTMTIIDSFVFNGCDNLTIHTPKNSYAAQYARRNNIKFVEA